MNTYLIVGLIWGLAIVQADPEFSRLFHGGEFDLGPYDAIVKIGELPHHYPTLSVTEKKASYSFRRLLELLRGSFPTGIYTLPSLDPYISTTLSPVTFNEPLLSGKVKLSRVAIAGLQKFDLELLELRVDSLRTDFSVKIPMLAGVVEFESNLVLGGLFPVAFNGKLRVKLLNVKVEGAVGATEKAIPNSAQVYSLCSLQARFHADDVKLSVDGLNLQEDILESLQSSEIFGSSVAMEPAKKVVNYYVAQQIIKQVNSILESFSTDQVNAYLLAR